MYLLYSLNKVLHYVVSTYYLLNEKFIDRLEDNENDP